MPSAAPIGEPPQLQAPWQGLVDAEKVGHLMSTYVTHGSLVAGDQFDAEFDFIAGRLPKHLTQCPGIVYRVLTLSATQANALQSSGFLTIDQRAYGSWTTNEQAALSFLRLRTFHAAPDDLLIIVKREVDPSLCIVNTEALYRDLGWTEGVHEWTMYVEWEQEVILRQNEPMATVTSEMVLHAFTPDDPKAVEPRPGERVWDLDREDFVLVGEVISADPHGRPEWRIRTDEDRSLTIIWDHRTDGWESAVRPRQNLPRFGEII